MMGGSTLISAIPVALHKGPGTMKSMATVLKGSKIIIYNLI